MTEHRTENPWRALLEAERDRATCVATCPYPFCAQGIRAATECPRNREREAAVADQLDPLTVADLPRVLFRANGQTVDAASATDDQFDAWARARVILVGHADHHWPLADRAALCDRLHRLGALVLLTPALVEELAEPQQEADAEADEAVLLEDPGRTGGESAAPPAPIPPTPQENREQTEEPEEA